MRVHSPPAFRLLAIALCAVVAAFPLAASANAFGVAPVPAINELPQFDQATPVAFDQHLIDNIANQANASGHSVVGEQNTERLATVDEFDVAASENPATAVAWVSQFDKDVINLAATDWAGQVSDGELDTGLARNATGGIEFDTERGLVAPATNLTGTNFTATWSTGEMDLAATMWTGKESRACFHDDVVFRVARMDPPEEMKCYPCCLSNGWCYPCC